MRDFRLLWQDLKHGRSGAPLKLLRKFHLIALCIFSLLGFFMSTSPASAVQTSKVPSKTVWHPKLGDTFQLQLSGALNTDIAADIYDIDLFDSSPSQIVLLKKSGRKVVCYFSGGSSEKWRPDFAKFSPADMGNPLQGWPGENWLDIRSSNVRKIMRARMDLATKKGCDGVDPDNVDGYSNSTGFALTGKNQLDYNKFLSYQAHLRGLAVGLKNDIAQIGVLASSFDFAVNEQCHEFDECAAYRAITLLGKPVLNVEYQQRYLHNTDGAFVSLCLTVRSEKLYTLVLPLLLDGTSRMSCD